MASPERTRFLFSSLANRVTMSESPELLERFLKREKAARKEAERLLEVRSRELYEANLELEAAASSLRDEAERTRAIFDTAAEAIIIFGQDGTIESINPAGKRMFLVENNDVEQLAIWDLIALENVELKGEQFAKAIRQALRNQAELFGIKLDGGLRFPIDLVVSEFTHSGRQAFTAIARDLTRRRALEAQLAHAQKMESVGQLAAGIAHEINTPIQYVGDNTRFLQSSFEDIHSVLAKISDAQSADTPPKPDDLVQNLFTAMEDADMEFLIEEIPQAIEQTLDGADNVARIVKAMKEFSHPGSEETQEIDLNKALDSTLTVSKNEWKYCSKLETDFDPNLPPVPCMPGELNQAFLNLIVNAGHAITDSGEEGRLRVSTRLEDDNVVVRIADTGCGIPEQARNRIFDPFFTTKAVGRGTGQGLAVVHSVVVEKHGGEISFESEVGKGTTFIIKLPLKAADVGRTEEFELAKQA